MPDGPKTVGPPATGLYRLARRGRDVFEPPDWDYADPEDGTFGNRFDDPRAKELPRDQCFRIIYCATERIGCFGETLARFRIPVSLLTGLEAIADDEPLDVTLAGVSDPADQTRMMIGADWRSQRVISHTVLDPSLQFVDLTAAQTIQHLRHPLAQDAANCGIPDIDESALLGPERDFTQRVARYFYEQQDDERQPLYAGLRYVSRLNLEWECWAVFSDRMKHASGMPGPPETIYPDDPDLMEIARLWSLTIETVPGTDRYLRP